MNASQTQLAKLTDRELLVLFTTGKPVRKRTGEMVTREEIQTENAYELVPRLLKLAQKRLRRHQWTMGVGVVLFLVSLMVAVSLMAAFERLQPGIYLGWLSLILLPFTLYSETAKARNFERKISEELAHLPGAKACLARVELAWSWWKLDEPNYALLTLSLSQLSATERKILLVQGETALCKWLQTLTSFALDRPTRNEFFATLLKMIAEEESLCYLDAVYRLTRVAVVSGKNYPLLDEADRTLKALTKKLRQNPPGNINRFLDFKSQCTGEDSSVPGFSDATCLYSVMRLLPELDADTELKSLQQDPLYREKWTTLYAQLVNAVPAERGKNQTIFPPFMHYPPEFFDILLDFIERSRDPLALSAVRRLAKRSARISPPTFHRERARALVSILEREQKLTQINATLLRASQIPTDSLLHPVRLPPTAKAEATVLLRPVSDDFQSEKSE